jgi:hypothetical protein
MIVLSFQFSLVGFVLHATFGINLIANLNLKNFAILILHLFSGSRLYSYGNSINSIFISLFRDFSRRDYLRAKTFPLLLRFASYLAALHSICDDSDLTHLLLLALLETLSDLFLRVFDHHPPPPHPLHPRSFTGTFLLHRLQARSPHSLYATLIWYTVLLFLTSGSLGVEMLTQAAQLAAFRLTLLYCEERYKASLRVSGGSLRLEGPRGYKILRRAHRAGERHLVIVIAQVLARGLGEGTSEVIRRRDEHSGQLEVVQVVRHMEQVAAESNEVVKNSMGILKVSQQSQEGLVKSKMARAEAMGNVTQPRVK